MPICPHCGAEYRDGVVVCADCQASLAPKDEVELRRAAMTTGVQQIRWRSLTGVPHQVAAVMLMGVLEAHDIPSRLEEHSIPAYGLPSMARGDAWGEVLVPLEHLNAARAVMDEYLAQLERDVEREYRESDAT